MPTIEAKRVIRAPAELVFHVAHDYELRKRWDRFTPVSTFTRGPADRRLGAAAGNRVRSRAYNGLSMEVEYEVVQRPRFAAMQMIRGPWFFAKFTGAWRFQAKGGHTETTFRYGFRARPAALRRLIEPLVGAVLRRDIRRRLQHLAEALEAGRFADVTPPPEVEPTPPAL
ncbi:MAG: SRPBCC family protein [Planctomycetota bacterium]